jgi:3-hydroxy-9,10-secoandrosta-1,3,5(10)-triene-9,17-dione monooxygenase reductase component
MIAENLTSTAKGDNSASRPPVSDPAAEIEFEQFRRVLSRFCTGLVVVTALCGTAPVGLTCQAFASLSLDPPLVMFGAAARSTSWPRIRAARRFAVNILSEHQEGTSRAFAVSNPDKFVGVRWFRGSHGCPLIDGALAYVECSIEAVHSAGDHEIVVGRVLALRDLPDPAEPLVYFSGQYRILAPSHAPGGGIGGSVHDQDTDLARS